MSRLTAINRGVNGAQFSTTPLFNADLFTPQIAAAALSIAVLSFLGFDGIATLSEEAKGGRRSAGIAMITGLVLVATRRRRRTRTPRVSYGLKNAPPCVVEALGENASYTGLIKSHPYSVDADRRSGWVVADAAGNDLLRVSEKGKVSTLAVLPRQRLVITKEVADSLKIPSTCDVIGKSYYTEAVPTDVEYDGGYYWVSILPGGPEAGARGKVYRVSKSGKVKEVASGFAGASNLERHSGKIYVAELFAGRISVIKNGGPKTYVQLPGALSVEWANGRLLAGTGVTGPSSIVRIG